MCGRFVGNYSVDDLLLEVRGTSNVVSIEIDDDVLPLFATVSRDDIDIGRTSDDRPGPMMDRWSNFNVAPSTTIPVLVSAQGSDHSYLLTAMTWGFVPSWNKEPRPGRTMINARSETVLEKPMFRSDIVSHRCLIPMTGFYEWDRTTGVKRPFFVTRTDGRMMWCLGLWGAPSYSNGHGSCALLTRESSGALAAIHDRAPVQTDIDDALEWLAPGAVRIELCAPEAQSGLVAHEVSARVNSVRNNDSSLIAHLEQSTLFD